ncbi:GumC family protein [Neorhizobium sp. NCHU2750]|uniref:GumC family protein n=1 Tax=Neorhizobium sp. NCHU2750 TaxID=1825976 RepID=UPI000E7506F5|nr:cell shape-determining protein [Neorhizobium sp. NCHU2750]
MYAILRPRRDNRAKNASDGKSDAAGNDSSVGGQPSLLSYMGPDEDAPQKAAPRNPEPFSISIPEISTAMVIGWLWVGKWLILLFIVLGALAGYGFGVFSKPKFTVGSQIFIDPANLRVVADDIFTSNNQLDMQIYDVESKLHILTSSNVLNSVIDALHLDSDPEFGDTKPTDPQTAKLDALRSLEKHVDAKREENSFVVNLDVSSQSAQKALQIANSIINNFQDELVKEQADGAERAAKELFARLDTLKDEVAKADEAVQRFKRDHNILSSSGELVSTIVANQTNTQLVDAQARVIRARSRYQELSTGSPESRLDSASIDNQTMSALRTQYTVAQRELDAQSAIYGSRHPRIAAMRPQIEAIQSQITAEQNRILAAAKSELAQAEAALTAQQAQANKMKSVVFADNDSLVQLRQLERESESKSNIYQAFMARAKELAERQKINTTNVRVISPPTIPKTRSYPPRTLYLLAGGMIGGLAIGAALVMVLSFLRLALRRPQGERAA